MAKKKENRNPEDALSGQEEINGDTVPEAGKAEGLAAPEEEETEAVPAAEAQDTPETVPDDESELEKMVSLADDYRRKWYSVSAEYDNYRKRTQTAVSQAYADGRNETLLKILPVADSFGYALDTAEGGTKTGIEKILKNFNAIIESLGVSEIPIAVGDEFHENIAEAITTVPCEEGEKPQTVRQILKKGYRSGEKVIRFAQVVVTI